MKLIANIKSLNIQSILPHLLILVPTYLKSIHISLRNRHLGPLQVNLPFINNLQFEIKLSIKIVDIELMFRRIHLLFLYQSLCLRQLAKTFIVILLVECRDSLLLIFLQLFHQQHTSTHQLLLLQLTLLHLKTLWCPLIARWSISRLWFLRLQIYYELHHLLLTVQPFTTSWHLLLVIAIASFVNLYTCLPGSIECLWFTFAGVDINIVELQITKRLPIPKTTFPQGLGSSIILSILLRL